MLSKRDKSKPETHSPLEFFDTVIGETTKIHGRLVLNAGIRIDGTVVGDIESAKSSDISVALGKNGVVEGDIHAHRILIAGQVEGNIYANETVELHESAVVNGDVTYGRLIIQQGASLNGLMISRTGEKPSGYTDPNAVFVFNGDWKKVQE